MDSQFAALVRRQAGDLAQRWACEIAACLNVDLSPYPSHEDPRLILGIASYLEAGESRTAAMLQLTRRAREWGRLAEMRGIGEEQVLDAYLILSELLRETLCVNLSGRDVDLILLHRLDTALMAVMRETVGAYRARHQERDRKASDEMRAFSRMLSHEIKGPASVISGVTELLLDPDLPQDATTREKYLQTIQRNGRSIAQIVDDLLALTMVDEQGNGQSEDVCSLPEVLAQVLDSLAGEAAKRGVRLEVGGSLPDLQIDRRATQLVLGNLVSNAIRYADLTRPDPFVRISAEPTDTPDEWWVRVQDNGLGIPSDARERIFERFFRAHTALPIIGTGLGLSIVHELVESWSGRIQVESSVGEGSVFSFTLPGSSPPAWSLPMARTVEDPEIDFDRVLPTERAIESERMKAGEGAGSNEYVY
jgi:signal transduction histidine kinase